MTAEERCAVYGYEDVELLEGYSYDDALIGVSGDGRAIYDFSKMVEWLVKTYGFTPDDASDWIENNTAAALEESDGGPIILYPIGP